jgi:paraquat-inducible protein B
MAFRGGPENPYPEIPTLPTAFEEIQQKLTEFIGELQTIELDSISRSATGLLQGMNELVRSPTLIAAVESLDTTLANTNYAIKDLQALLEDIDTQVVPAVAGLDTVRARAAAAMQETEATMASLRVLLEPGSPIAYQLEAAFKELAAASRAMQALVDYLERNPGALVRGRETKEENR